MNIADTTTTLSSIYSLGDTSRTGGSVTTSDSSATQSASKQAEQRRQQEQHTVTSPDAASAQVHLSAAGQLHASVNQLQESAKTLTDTSNTNTVEKARAAAEQYATAYNTARTAANRVAAGEQNANGSTGAVPNDHTAAAAAQLNQALDKVSQSDQINNAGLNANANGTVSVNSQALTQAAQNNPQGLSSALAATGRVTQQQISQRNTEQANQEQQASQQQTTQQQTAETQQQSVEQTNNNRLNAVKSSGAAAYQRIFSL